MEVIDASVRDTCQTHEALRCIHVGLLCVLEAPADRPTMSSVIHMLQGNEATFLFNLLKNLVFQHIRILVLLTLPQHLEKRCDKHSQSTRQSVISPFTRLTV